MNVVTVRELVLETVQQEPGSTAADIANELKCSTSTATRFAVYWCEQGRLKRQQMRSSRGIVSWCYRPV